ncbi:MAG: MFS transporter [Promethearchaeota archaeon]
MKNQDKNAAPPSAERKMYVFAFPRIGSSLLLGIVGFALFSLYTTGYQLDGFRAGLAIALGYVSIAASQFFLGWISDAKYTRWGRRKPFIIILSPLLVVSFIMLLMPTLVLKDPSTDTLFVWLVVWDVIFEASYGMTTPYQSWMAEQFEVDERPKCSQVQNTFNYVGNGTVVVFTFLVLTNFKDSLEENPGTIPPDFFWSCVVFAAIFLVGFYLSAFLMPTEPPPKKKPDLLANLKNILKNRNYLLVVLMQGFASLAWVVVTTVMLNYTEVVLDFGTFEYVLAGVALLLGIFVFLYVWRVLIGKVGKTKALLYLFLYAAATLPLSLLGLAPFGSTGTTAFGLFFIVLIASILGGWFLFPYIMYADMAEDEEKRTEEMNAGIYIGFPSIVLNLFQALGTFLLGLLTSLPDLDVRGLTFSLGYVLWGPFCAVVLLGTYFYTRKFVNLDFAWEDASRTPAGELTGGSSQ